MEKILRTLQKLLAGTLAGAIAGTIGINLAIAIAEEISPLPTDSPDASIDENHPLAQITSVSQLSDVKPTDWAFEALQFLVERYGCIAGNPDGTYQGSRPITRYEFGAGLSACLDKITELMATSEGNLVTKNDLALLERLQAEANP